MNAFDLLSHLKPAQIALFILILSIPGMIAGLLAGALLNRAAYALFRAFARSVRIVFWPVRALLRLFGIKMIAKSRPARIAIIGTRSTVRKKPGHLTEIDWALEQPDETAGEDGTGEARTLYDFSEEHQLLRTQGRIFHWFRIPGEYIPRSLANPFTDEIAGDYALRAGRFFKQQIPLFVNPNALYEDAEGAVIVSMFKGSDRRCFYALDQLRRVINRNALHLIVCLALSVAAAAAILRFSLVAPAPSWIVVGLGFAGLAALTFLCQLLYANQQRQNMREFSDFLTRYLSLISNRFREASATASRVIQGDERDSKVLAANAQKWQKIMMWLSFRPFFIEAFVRNENFQLRRNLGYYMVGGALAFAFTAVVFFFGAGAFAAPVAAGNWAIAGLLASLFVALCTWQTRRKVVFEELNQMNWLGYDNLDVGKQMDEVIGKYAEYIGLWISRFDR